jgi:dihydroflavonol-4-reductase
MKNKVLVTGISGFVGQHCALELLKQGYQVKGSLRNPLKEVEVREGIAKFIDPKNQLEFCTLDLSKDEGWEEAMRDCTYVLHVASPFYFKQTKDEKEFIKPAKEGTLRALRAAQKAKVKRVVVTSSTAAMSSHMYKGPFSSKDWTDLSDKNISTYAISKTMAEKAAWDFFRSQKGDHSIELVVINPGGITGPSLTHNLDGTSMGMVAQMIGGKMSMVPDLSFPMVDVRDVAKLHVQALTKKDINGKRFIAARKQTTHFLEIASILKENGYEKASTKKAPLFLLKIIALFDPEVKALLTSVGKHPTVDISDTEATFDWDPIPLKKSVLDMAQSVEQALQPDNQA